MANNAKHNSLATIAHMITRWDKLVDDINEAITEVQIVLESDDSEEECDQLE